MVGNPELDRFPDCFGCGARNPAGLKLSLRLEDGELTTEFVPKGEHQGWPGIVHGGIITSLLYEVLENLPYYQGVVTMMKSMDTRFRRAARTGAKIFATARLVDHSERTMNVSAKLTDEDGELIAEGDTVLVILSRNQKEKLGLA